MVRYWSAKECDASLVGMIGKLEIGYRYTLYICTRDLFDPLALYWIDAEAVSFRRRVVADVEPTVMTMAGIAVSC